MVKNTILRQLSKIDPSRKLVLYFSGTLNQCIILKTILRETKNSLLVYYFDKTKYQADTKEEQNRALEILRNYQKWHRDFTFTEIKLSQDEEVKNLDDLFFHEKLLSISNKDLTGFDSYIISQDLSFFRNQLQVLEFYNRFKKSNPHINLIAPIATLEPKEISKAAFLNILNNDEISFDKIYCENRELIESIKLLDTKKGMEIEYLLTIDTDYNSIYKYLLFKSHLSLKTFIKKFGHLVDKELLTKSLTELSFTPHNESLISLLINYGDISQEELNKILLNKVRYFAGYKDRASQARVDEIDYFFRLYEHNIYEETKDQLLWIAYDFFDYHYEPLLDKLVDWKCDVGNLLLSMIDKAVIGCVEKKASNLIEKYHEKIHQLQLNEALLIAFRRNLYSLCQRLIDAGAKREMLQFHSKSYADELWKNNQERDFKLRYTYCRTKDLVVIKEILKELGNPQDKVPPVIHVTGSNGKGSTCAFLKSILEKNGYKSHVFTSPGIVRANENFIISGEEISDEDYYNYLRISEEAFNRIKNSEGFKSKVDEANKFDNLSQQQAQEDGYRDWSIIVPAIILAFSENKADATIIEVVVGGELDVTNVFDAKTTIATIVNSIIFGDGHASAAFHDIPNIEGVARTKSRLARNCVPIFSAKQEDSVIKEIIKTSEEKNSLLFIMGKDFLSQIIDDKYFTYKGFGKDFKLQKPRMVGEYQVNNAALALSALLQVNKFNLSESGILEGIAQANQTARFTKIEESIIAGCRRIYFGSVKSKFGISALQNLDKVSSNIIVKFNKYSDEFVGGSLENELKSFDKIILLDVDQSEQDAIRKKMKALSFEQKKYLSSSIARLDIENQPSQVSLILCVVGIVKFPGYYLSLFKQIQQSNFTKDLEFAKKNQMLDEEKIEMMSASS